MAVALVSAGSGPTVQSTSATVSAPSGARSGDLLVIALYLDVTSNVAVDPRGWTRAVAINGSAWSHTVWTVPFDSFGSGAIAWGGATAWNDWVCAAFRGADLTTPVNATSSGRGFDDAPSAPSQTTTVDGCLLLFSAVADTDITATPPAGMDEVIDQGDGDYLAVASAAQSRAGATGSVTATLSRDWNWTAILLALAPAASSTVSLTGTIAITATPSGTLGASTALSGTASLSVTPSGTLSTTSDAALTGTAALTVTPSATLSAGTAVTGTASIEITPSGALTLTSSAALEGDVPISVTPSGTLSVSGGPETWTPVTSPIRPTWDEMLAGPHRVVVKASLLRNGATVMDLPVLDGSVTLDANAATRGRLDLTVSGIAEDGITSLVPSDPSSLLAPYGNEIQVSRGIRYPDGGDELVPLGVFGIYESDVSEQGSVPQVQIAGQDRSQRIIDARFEAPYEVAAGTNYVTAILDVIQDAYPDVVHDLMTTSLTTPALVAEEQSDRWQFAQSMASAIAAELFFDGAGVLILRPIVQPGAGFPDVYLEEGVNSVLVSASSTWTRDGARNRIVATGENTGDDVPPARGVATDDNPHSPTYYYGPFGRVPAFYVSEFITTDQQAAVAAAAQLARQLGTTRSVAFGTVVNPRIQPGIVARITRQRVGITAEDHVVDSITIPLSATGSMSGATRAVQVFS